ncbi:MULTISPECIES: acyl carrier protein [unclassified Duganella]|uniref:acyl carrier protein n=1 Tax=unclassified Duganella TaxID=2636909 RepID=UPI000E35490F|nr:MULTISPECIES: acyl carrier protein [unclassified Duganella]RFP19480.1 acyl carrier protein [Duganella sp. BJB475]RFP36061.1 acyl carrier protein [Duganella sp. BJB476]
MPVIDQVCQTLRTTLGLAKMPLNQDTLLLGSVPELDSMAVVNLIMALEQQFGISVDDDEINARHFFTVGTLAAFVQGKLA